MPTLSGCCSKPTRQHGRFSSGRNFEGEAGTVLDFWVEQGGCTKFVLLCRKDSDGKSLPPSVHGIKLQVLRRPDTIAYARRIENWAPILPYRTSSLRHANRRLQNNPFARLAKPHQLERSAAAFHPIDVSAVRAALFDLLMEGRVSAQDLDFAPLGLDTVFRRGAP